jgi:hypothetical protein
LEDLESDGKRNWPLERVVVGTRHADVQLPLLQPSHPELVRSCRSDAPANLDGRRSMISFYPILIFGSRTYPLDLHDELHLQLVDDAW